MKLAISNIAWDASLDTKMYETLKELGVSGLEIAPTRIFPEQPYDRVAEAKEWAARLYETYGLTIPSMQSIWYGRTEKLFGTEAERVALMDYTKKAIDFAATIGCKNLVFGSPRNRAVSSDMPVDMVGEIENRFFSDLGKYAAENGTVVAMEANPTIYHTNYINKTEEAVDLVKRVDSPGFKINLDVGTMIVGGESVNDLEKIVPFINHVHISEPGLALIEKRSMHKELVRVLKEADYSGFVSIEMGKRDSFSDVLETLKYVKRIVEEE